MNNNLSTSSTAIFSLLVLFWVIGMNAQAADSGCKLLTTPYTATYFGSFKGWRIDTAQELKHLEKNGWELSLQATNFMGDIREESAYLLTSRNTIQSVSYEYQRNLVVKKSTYTTHFDEKTRRAVTSGNKQGTVTLLGSELDNLNYQLQLRCDLMAGKPALVYPVVDRDEVDHIEFKIVGEEVLDTKLGKLNTVVVKRVRNNDKRVTTLWFAKDKDYLMVKLLQEEKKDTEAYLLYVGTYKK